MPIDAGDVVLTFIGDMTQLDAAFNKVANEAAAKMQPVQAAVSGVGKAGVDAGTSLADAFRLLPPVVQQTDAQLQNMAFALTGLAAPAMREVVEETHHARGAFGLLNEASRESIGVGMPRHIRTFLAELPGVGAAMNSAFSAIAVLFLIDIIGKVIEKIADLAHQAEHIDEAWRKVDVTQRKVFESLEDDLLKAQIKTAELTNNHMEALRLKLQLIDNTSLSKLEAEIERIAKAARDAFKDIEPNILQRAFFPETIDEVKKKFQDVTTTVQDALSPRTPQAYTHALNILNDALTETQKKISSLDAQSQKNKTAAAATAALPGGFVSPVNPDVIKSYDELHVKFEQLKKDIKESQAANLEQKKDLGLEEQNRVANQAIKSGKERLQLERELEKATEKRDQAQKQLNEEHAKFDKLSHDTIAQMEKFGEVEVEIKNNNPFSKQVQDAIRLNDALKAIGVQGLLTVGNDLTKIAHAEKLLNEAGIHEGRIWLQVQIAKQKAIIKTAHDQHQATDQEVKDLKRLERELKSYDGIVKDSKSQVAAAWIGEALAAGFAADSIGAAAQAILRSVLQSLAGMAFAKGTEQLAEAFARLNPYYAATHGPPGPHFAAAAEWFALGGAASIVSTVAGGGGGGSSSSSGSGGGPTIDKGATANQPAQQPVLAQNVAHFASGGLAMRPMMATVAEQGPEAVLPLNDAVMGRLASAIAAHGASGGAMTLVIEPGVISKRVIRQISNQQSKGVNKGEIRVLSSNSLKVTKRHI